jgi:plastocyanin
MHPFRYLRPITPALVLGITVSLFGLAATGQAAGGHAAAAAQTKHVVAKEVNDKYMFAPHAVSVAKGTKVVWTNKSDAEHNVTITKGMKVNKDFKAGKTVSVTFARAGTYQYHCEYHPYMTGVITVH